MRMKDYIIYSLSANKKLAKEVANVLNAEVGKARVRHFADGEVLTKTLTDASNKDVVIIQSTSKPATPRLFEVLLLIDSIKRQSPKSITLFVPYLGYSRQERVSWTNEPVSAQVVANVLDTAEVDRILTFDLHHPIIEDFFKTPIENISTAPLFIEYFKQVFQERNIKNEEVVIVSPDHGSNLRSKHVAEGFPNSHLVVLNKVRPQPNRAEHLTTKERFDDKVCLIVDDIIDTAGTIASAAKLLYSRGAREVLVAASHPVLSKDALLTLKNANIKAIAVTNTIEKKIKGDIKVLDILPLIVKKL